MELRGTFEFEPSGFFVVRTPLLPWSELASWSDGLTAPEANKDTLSSALATDRIRLRERLREAVLRPEVREAIFVASPSLEASIETWLREPENEQGAGIELALARYYERMCARATPFGLCAGISVGQTGTRTRLMLAERVKYRRHTRPDMKYLGALIRLLEQIPELRNQLTFRPNSTLYQAGGRLRYIERRHSEEGFSDCVVSAERSDHLAMTLQRAADGQRMEALAESLAEGEISREEALAFIDELVASHILVPDLPSQITGPEPLPALLASLRRLGRPAAEARGKLELLQRELAALDGAGLGRPPQAYRDLSKHIDPIPVKPELTTMFQVDMVKPALQATLDKIALTEIARGIELLRHVSRGSGANEITRFRDAFLARYEYREVPLVEALDEECGLPFPVPDDAGEIDGAPRRQRLGLDKWSDVDTWMLRKLAQALSSGATEIVLDPKEVEARGDKSLSPLPNAFAIIATLAADSEASLDTGKYHVLLQSLEGPSGAELLGRFCHSDESLTEHVRQHLVREETLQPSALFAEIVHLPESRVANVLARPVLRGYEIPYLGDSGAGPEQQLPVTDLWLRVEAEKLTLHSMRLGRRVIPRMTTAHNFSLSKVPIYHFLCALAHDEAVAVGWNWGLLAQSPFLPRVSCGRLVFSRATWNLERAELAKLKQPTLEGRFAAAQRLRIAHQLPRWTLLWDADHALPVDFNNCLSVQNFFHLVHQRQGIRLTELYPGPDQLVARGPEGRFVHELIVPFVRKANEELDSQRTKRPNAGAESAGAAARLPRSQLLSSSAVHLKNTPLQRAEQRAHDREAVPTSSPNPAPLDCTAARLAATPEMFAPGSSWLFAKLYCGPATGDFFLRQLLPGFVEHARARGWIDRWYFIRYADPYHHLRIRFRGEPECLYGRLLAELHAELQPYLRSKALARWQIDTYHRETRRYGGPNAIELAEELFEADSDAVLAMLSAAGSGDVANSQRWRLAVCGVDRMLKDLGLDLKARVGIVTVARVGRTPPTGLDPEKEHKLSEDFRRERQSLETLLRGEVPSDTLLSAAIKPLAARAARLAPLGSQLRELLRSGRLSQSLEELSLSYIHMHINRLLRSRHQEFELVIYDALKRLYQSMVARQAHAPCSTDMESTTGLRNKTRGT